MMNYLLGFILVFVVLGVVVLGMTFVPYQGVIALMGVSFSCCMLMVLLGRTFAALVMYIVYLGGLVVVFGYCVSVEKGGKESFKVSWSSYLVFLIVVLVSLYSDFGGLLTYSDWENMACMEINGGAVFYCSGGVGLVVCSWGLLVVLFSVLVILGWSRLGGLRPF
uniref:NADH-ubiquinone oxidoreductase chain 6 n=1 Tax=Bungarus multicinctus TaxID=8616 RepID=B6CWK8_BUNMU|nr:NADH dehydrogenase subunit 6 [Bungarus multicinctus]ACB36663.1 NADH dehydrogenase subunit 6 [Bungarus multicinctus]WOV69010.1 NADH dehydrogenase subunit 6 [Bungarus multicinctus]